MAIGKIHITTSPLKPVISILPNDDVRINVQFGPVTVSGSGFLLASNNLSDVANAATAFGNIKQAATTSATGVVELATDGEAIAGVVVQGNDSRLQAGTVVPGTVPSAGQILVGNAGGTAYEPKTMSGDAALASTGALTIAASVVTNAKLANMAQGTIKGRVAGSGSGAPVDLTATQATAILDVFTGDSGAGGVKGLVPAPAAGDAAAGKFLKADGTFAVPPGTGGGTVTNTGTLTANRIILGNGGVDIVALGSLGTANTVLHGNAAGAPTFGAVNLAADVSGTLPLANGGTGQTSAQTAINALMAASGALSQGDVFYYNGTNVVRLAPGTNGDFLQTQGAGANPQWATAGSGSGNVTAAGTLDNNAIVIGQGTTAVATTSTATGILTFLGTPSSANLAAAVTDETGSGLLVFGTSPVFSTDITLPNGTAPTTGSVAKVAFDTNAWGASRGAIQVHDGTANTYVVAALASDTPSNGQVPTWNTGGTVTWETPGAGSGSPQTWVYAFGGSSLTDPSSGQFTTDNAAPSGTTNILLSNTSANGAANLFDMFQVFGDLSPPWIAIQFTDSAGRVSYFRFASISAGDTPPQVSFSSIDSASALDTTNWSGNYYVSFVPYGSNTPDLGIPADGNLQNCDGLPISTGVSGLGANVATFLATPSSANLASALTDKTGTGLAVFNNSPTFLDDITVGTAGGATGQVLFKGTTSGTVTLSVADAAGTWTMKLPTTDGNANEFLKTDGGGNTSWSAPTGGATNIWVPASAMIPRTTNGAGVNSSETATNDVNYDTLDFDATTSEGAQFWVVMPNNWTPGTVTFKPFWTADSGTGTFICTLAARDFANDDALDQAFGTAQSSTDTLLATGDMHIGPASSAITIAGTPANGDAICFQVTRDVGDTLNADARLIGIEITFS